MKVSKTISFEEALQQLQSVVERLESGQLSLDDALAQFEHGIKLSRQCSQLLDQAETKVKLLLQDAAGNVQETPFLPENGQS